jgi:uncharacterized protein YndB with AHSA1/START domain
MTRQKQLKRRVRARMEKTGERYAAARRQVLDRAPQTEAPQPAREPISGQRFSDEVMWRRTGRGWEEWLALLDAWGATERGHGEIARWLTEEHAVPGWWAQSVTVGYEQARGMRQPGQVAGGFAASASKTIAVPVDRLFAAFVDDELRARWLPDAPFGIRTARPGRSLRANWHDGDTRVNVGFTARSESKSQVAVQHERLPDRETAERMKAFWRQRLAELQTQLEDR